MYAGGGALIDRLGTRRGFVVIMICVVARLRQPRPGHRLLDRSPLSRFLLGAGEGGGFPAATKAVAEWFPARERSTAMGIINAGTAVGAVVAPPADRRDRAVRPTGGGRSSPAARSGLLWTVWWCAPTTRRQTTAAVGRRTRTIIGEVARGGAGGRAADPWLGSWASRRCGASCSPSSSPTAPGTSTSSGCRSISTTRAAST